MDKMQSLIAAAIEIEGIDLDNYLSMDTSSCGENSAAAAAAMAMPLEVAYPYPSPLATYDNIVASHQLFMDTLTNLHESMQTKFRIPVMGGKPLDLHLLFIEVTKRGGVEKVIAEKKWKDVKRAFNLPRSATNASFLLKKHYNKLLAHYESVYYTKLTHWNPSPSDDQPQVPDVDSTNERGDEEPQSCMEITLYEEPELIVPKSLFDEYVIIEEC